MKTNSPRVARARASKRIAMILSALTLVIASVAVNAGGASAAMCPYGCADPSYTAQKCSLYGRTVASVWVGGAFNASAQTVYSPLPYCGEVSGPALGGNAWGRTQGNAWSGVFFTRTTPNFTYTRFNQDTLGLGLGYGSGNWKWTRMLPDGWYWAFTCGWTGQSWVCTYPY